jgi:hypothetical protein
MKPAIIDELESVLGNCFLDNEVYIGGVPLPDTDFTREDELERIEPWSNLVAKEAAFLDPNSKLRRMLLQSNIPMIQLPYPRRKQGGQAKDKNKGRKGTNESNVPEGARLIHERLNRPNLRTLARVLPGHEYGSRAFGY